MACPKRLLSWAALIDFALSQTTVASYVPAASTSTSSEGITHTVSAGYGGFTFTPDVIQANIGDTVQFDFYPLNHSVVRAEYKVPCVPYELTGPKIGFFSGFMPVDAILTNPPTWSVVVNDTDPIFYYCSAPGSCIHYAMVGVINPNASVSLEVQKEYALNSSFMLEPGQSWPSETSSTILPATTSSVVSTPTSVPVQTTSAAPISSHSTGLSVSAIAGIAIGGAAVLIAAVFLIWWCGRQSRRNPPSEAPPTYVPPQFSAYAPISPSAKYMSGVTNNRSYLNTEQPNITAFGPMQMNSPEQYPSPRHDQSSPTMDPYGQPSVTKLHPIRDGNANPTSGGGIAAFLERNGRMSPSMEGHNEGANRSSMIGSSTTPGPYEMSASDSTVPRG